MACAIGLSVTYGTDPEQSLQMTGNMKKLWLRHDDVPDLQTPGKRTELRRALAECNKSEVWMIQVCPMHTMPTVLKGSPPQNRFLYATVVSIILHSYVILLLFCN